MVPPPSDPTDPVPIALTDIDVAPLVAGDPDGSGEVAAGLDRAWSTHGFVAVRGHGVPDEVREEAFDTVRAVFALDPATKDGLRVECPPGVQRGYAGLGAEAQAAAVGERTPPDLSETYAVGDAPHPGHGPFAARNVWPPVPGFRPAWERYRAAMVDLAATLLRGCAIALEGDDRAFDDLVRSPIGSTRANHYPALDRAPAPGQWRGGAHTDYGFVTVLATDGEPGLEIRDADDRWGPVAAPAGSFVVNVGDLLAHLSGGRWRSTWHRVAVPAGPPPHPARTSIAHFQFPDHGVVLPGLGGLTAGQILRDKLDRLLAVGPATEGDR